MPTALSRAELIRKFRGLGYSGPFSGKRHQFMQLGSQKIHIPNPHGNQSIGAGLISEIMPPKYYDMPLGKRVNRAVWRVTALSWNLFE